MAARMSIVEEELSKADYAEESHAVLQQQLTGVEVKVSRMEAEWGNRPRGARETAQHVDFVQPSICASHR